ncbi:endolytic transglycosylase MltG [Nocardioides marmoribigeumensis]|uniref:Endolytic murein transglycosylase n=1 Tax=Nocardioides marmoribigeumensis TaxID=433649 RepID=A0ABU2BRW4_9ACTN|nr:endolytic transglycosylase MltG [Nocardioides marmoribigeumensis]MDR7361011.1 UPF0755 protein [Nocardioides marmoribigeumensis]
MSLERDRDDEHGFSLFGQDEPPHEEVAQEGAPLTAEEEGRSFFSDLEPAPRRHRRLGSLKSCLVLIVVAALVVAGAVAAFTFGKDKIDALMAPPPDYDGPGTGSVLFEVKQGDTTTEIARHLKAQGVVKSVDAFSEAAKDDADAQDIQVGFYQLKKQLPAADALEVLVDPANLVQASVTIPEGLRVSDILPRLAKATDIPLARYKKAVKDAKGIGLPSYAKGNAEGYLFPATYAFPPNAGATKVLATMVDRWRQAADEADLEGAAKKLGYTPGQLMIVASLVESEANRDQDRGKVARVIYNRLETNATDKLLQIDATVNYALGRDLGLGLTTEDLQVDSPYNTRKYPGLPPTPIEAPGDEAIAAAADPTPGDWIYYVTVNLDTGETRFTKDYDQFLSWKNNDLAKFCAGSDRC